MDAFKAVAGGTLALAVTATTARKQVYTTAKRGSTWLVENIGPSRCFVKGGDATVEATVPSTSAAGGMPLPVGTVQSLRFGDATYLAAICDTGGTATLYITPGEGV